LTAEQFLQSVQHSNDQLGKLVRLQSSLNSPDFPQTPGERQARAEELQEQINLAYGYSRQVRRRVQNFIDRLPDDREREMLKLLFLSLLRMEDAAGVMGLSIRQGYRIKRLALMHLEGMRS